MKRTLSPLWILFGLLLWSTAGCSLSSVETYLSSLPQPSLPVPKIDLTRAGVPVPNLIITRNAVPTFPSTPTITSTPPPTPTGTPVAPVHEGTPLPVNLKEISAGNAGQLQLLSRWGKGIPRGLKFSPDGKYLAVPTTGGVYLYDGFTLQPAGEIQTGQMHRCVVFSADSTLLASGTGDGSIFIWKVSDLSQVLHFQGESQFIEHLVFSPDGKTLAASAWDNSISLIDVGSGEFIRRLEKHRHAVMDMVFSANGKFLYSFAPEEMGLAWEWAKGGASPREIYLGKMDGKLPQKGAFSADGSMIAVNFSLRTQVFHTDGTKVRLLQETGEPPLALLFSPDGSQLMMVKNNQLNLWQVESGKPGAQIKFGAGGKKMAGLQFTPDGQRIVGVSDRLTVWALESEPSASFPRPVEFTANFTLFDQADSDGLFIAGMDGNVYRFNPEAVDLSLVVSFPEAYMCSLAYRPASGLAAVNGCGKKFSLWTLADLQGKEFEPSKKAVRSLQLSPDGKFVAAGSDDHFLYLYHTADASLAYKMELAASPQQIIFSPDGRQMLVLAGEYYLLDSEKGQFIRRFGAEAALFSPDGTKVLLFSMWMGSRKVEIWPSSGSEKLLSFDVQGGPRIAISPDGSLLAVGGDQVTLWRLADGALLGRLGNGPFYGFLRFSGDGRSLVHIARDGRVIAWGVP